jgi:putative ABC transport system permease protein
VIAIPSAMLIGRWYAGFTSTLLNFDTTGFSIPRWSIAIQIAAGIILPVAAAAIPVIRGSRISVSEALRDFGIGAQGSDALLRKIGGLNRPLLLALRNALRKRQRTILTLVTLALGGAVYVGALNLRTSIRNSVSYLFGTLNQYDQMIRFTEPHSVDSLQTLIASVRGVTSVEAWHVQNAAISIGGSEIGVSFPIVGLPAGSKMVAYPVIAGRWIKPDDRNALVIAKPLAAEDPAFRVGTTIPIVIDGRIMNWTVVGIVEAGAQGMAFTTPEAVIAAIGRSTVGLVVVKAPATTAEDEAAISRSIRERTTEAGLYVSSIQLIAESKRVIEDHLLLVASFLLVMSQAMIVVGGLGLASTMSLAVLERTREIGVLRAIGARHRSILALIQIEALAMAITAWLLAIPLSLPASILIGKVFGRIMLPVPVTLVPDFAAVMQWLVVVVVVSIVASAWPAYRATRITTARALSYE